jgi:hypothetical protein
VENYSNIGHKADLMTVCAIGYIDFHNLMGFTSKKLPKNIPKNVCEKSFSIG